ncbi:AGE family epimerase/isomerase [Halioglobus maricola]|uniref:AGE family epimerase/isomerase n=1 Tax=Halioglobus maricola TaxID=2601894 RepID=UPI001478C1DB|nr:AGE family epimerase/isomerase [Halioglobus maricola]
MTFLPAVTAARLKSGWVEQGNPCIDAMTSHSPSVSTAAARAELARIQHWWLTKSIDPRGGFMGEIDHQGRAVPGANKGVVLHCRILWFFSAHAHHSDDRESLQAAQQAYDYLLEHFDDPLEGGVFWELSANGQALNIRKQTYATCYAIYALAAYHRASGNAAALTKALAYFQVLERNARNHCCGGYFEAFSRDWTPLQDTRLGTGDHNFPIKMNTHLHAVEAFSALYREAGDPLVRQRLLELLELFDTYFIDEASGHLRQCFELHWVDKSPIRSYGHDLEAGWMLYRAAQRVEDTEMTTRFRRHLLHIADTCLDEGFGDRGQLCSKLDLNSGKRDDTSVWWVQAEALIGFATAYRVSGETRYLAACERIWQALESHRDEKHGEWHAETIRGTPCLTPGLYKAGTWKGPYHNGRAMLRLIDLLADAGTEVDYVRAS